MNRSRVSQRSLINLLHVTALLIAMLVVVVGCASETPAAVPIDEATDSAPPPSTEVVVEPTLAPTATSNLTSAPTATQRPGSTLAPSVANTPTPPPTPTTEASGTQQPVETASPTSTPQALPGTWRGLVVAPEDRCSPYDSDDYPYSPSVEKRIVETMNGLVYGPYTGTHFEDTSQTDIEHIVARSEVHDSGLCSADAETKKRFASDILNLTLASPEVNRHQKSGKDAAEWLPDLNQCWFADRVVQVRQEYKLTIDEIEAAALEIVLSGCSSVAMVISAISASPPTAMPDPTPVADALAMYDDNGNGRITCAEARDHGIAPVHSDHPAYQYMNDSDGDGIVCE